MKVKENLISEQGLNTLASVALVLYIFLANHFKSVPLLLMPFT